MFSFLFCFVFMLSIMLILLGYTILLTLFTLCFCQKVGLFRCKHHKRVNFAFFFFKSAGTIKYFSRPHQRKRGGGKFIGLTERKKLAHCASTRLHQELEQKAKYYRYRTKINSRVNPCVACRKVLRNAPYIK